MNIKEEIKKILIQQAQERLEKAMEASVSAKSLTIEGDLKSDGKYDTRGIEAGYLAGAQAKRVEEIKQDIELLESIEFQASNDTVSIGSLIDLDFNGNIRKHFLSSASGGTLLKVQEETILIISVFSPIGRELVNLSLGDDFEVSAGNSNRIYTVKSIY